jgi:hypothetical protein
VGLWRGFRVGASFEGGYSRTGVIGLYDEPTTLEVSGVEVFAGYWLKFDLVSLYVRGGWGNYAYLQTVQSPAARNFPVDARSQTVVAAAGLNVYLLERLYICGEVKYVPSVKPTNRGRLSVAIPNRHRLHGLSKPLLDNSGRGITV